MSGELTLMAVHAHPDDEASSTGGILAKYSAEGVRTVVVTCTNGEFGDGPGGVKPGADGHVKDAVAQTRLAELRASCGILGVSELVTLGYHDSGMPEWEYRHNPGAFCNVPLAEVSGRISTLIEKYRPQVVVTYDPDSLYAHPDHVHACQSAIAAVTASGIPAKLYLTAMRISSFQKIRDALAAQGADVGDWQASEEEQRLALEAEARITSTVDIGQVMGRKRDALLAHSSQISDSWFSKIPPEIAAEAFGMEYFIRAKDLTGAPPPETDLFAGLR